MSARRAITPAPPRQPDEEDAIARAVEWIVTTPDRPRVLVPVLRRDFGLSALGACRAIAPANDEKAD